MENERKSSGINIGSASIIMVFAVLCLTVFAVLTFVTANSEYKLAVKSSDNVVKYYEADSKASDKLAVVMDAVDKAGGTSAVASSLKNSDIKDDLNVEESGNKLVIKFTETVSENQDLSVVLTYDGGNLKVNEWKLVKTGEWTPSDDVNVWDGELFDGFNDAA